MTSLAQANSSWDGSTGDWTDASRWSTADFPENGNSGLDYNAFINAGSVTLDSFVIINLLEIGGGELAVEPFAQLNLDDLDLVGGTISGGGTISTANLNVLNSATLSGVTVELEFGGGLNVGNINSTVTLNNGATVINRSNLTPQRASGGGDPLTTADYTLFNDGGTGTNRFVNQSGGVFFKPNGSATLNVGVRFDNQGQVEVNQGRLGLLQGGVSSGDFDIDAPGTIQFRGSHQLENAFVSGDGTVQVLQGTLSIGDSTNYFVGSTQIQAGTLEVDRSLQHSTEFLGLFDDAQVVDATSGPVTPQQFAVERTLEIQTASAVATLRGVDIELGMPGGGGVSSVDFLSGQLVVDEGSTINHRGTFNLELANPGIQAFDITPITAGPTGTNTFVNQSGGLVSKNAGDGVLSFDIAFNNEGSVEVNQGTLALLRGGVSSGDFDIESLGTLQFTGNHQLEDAFVSGDGTVQVSQGTLSINNNTNYSVGTTQVQAGGTLEVDRSLPHNTEFLELTGDAQVVDATSGPTTPQLFNVDRTLVIDTQSDVATARGMQIELGMPGGGGVSSIDYLSGQLVLDEGTTLENRGIVNLELGNPDVQRDDITPITAGPTGVNTFVNQSGGAINKLVDNGELNFDVAFNNEGSVSVGRGELRFNRGGVSTGDFDVEQFGELIFAGGHDLSGAFITGDGDVTFEAGPAPSALTSALSLTSPQANVIGASTVYNIGGRTYLESGTLTINTDFAESESLLLSSGVLNGTGTITIDFLTAEGDVQVDGVQVVVTNTYRASGGALVYTGGGGLDVQGDFDIDEESSFKAVFDGTKGEIANRFDAQGAGDISGLLEIELARDFTAEVGDVFVLFSAQQGITGDFRNVGLGETITVGDYTFSLIDPDADAQSIAEASLSLAPLNGITVLPNQFALQVDSVVPEPGTIGILGLGAGLLLARRRRGSA